MHYFALLVLACVVTCAFAQKLGVPDPNPAAGAFVTGNYRNLLADQHHPPREIQRRLDVTFAQLFHGDPSMQTVYYTAGANVNGPMAYIANHDVRSEGMSYGMMIAVQTNHKAEFDALWNWANTYMRITDPANPSIGYYAWSMNVDGTPKSDDAAADGEEYFAMSLYFAAHRWGNGQGLYNYQAQADRILHEMRHHPVLTSTGPFRIHPQDPPYVPEEPRRKVTVGPMVDEAHHMILLVPASGSHDFTDASYHLPAFYELWSRWGPLEDRAFWAEAARVSRNFFVAETNPQTALGPDYANFDGTPVNLPSDPMAANFSYDSWRTVGNWSFDEAWFAANPAARMLADRYQAFLIAQGIHTFVNRYTLDGKPLSTLHSTGMVANAATASLAATPGPNASAFVEELWNTPIPQGKNRYYDGMLYMMNMLEISGNYRIWMPRKSLSDSSVVNSVSVKRANKQ